MSKLDEAIILATQAHAGQVDKGGAPYILHPLRVMLACKTEEERVVAVLHDVVEDCAITRSFVISQFGHEIGYAVDALTREEGESYADFIQRCAANPIARVVKLADIADNMDVSRLGREADHRDAKRLRRYGEARAILLNEARAALGLLDMQPTKPAT